MRSLGVVLSMLLVSACGAAGGTPPPPSAVPVPPVPDSLKKPDRLGATSFASHWLDLMDYAYRTLDSAPLHGLGLPSCQTCTQFTVQLDRDRSAGARYEGGRVHFLSAEPESVDEGKQARIDVLFDQDELKVRDGKDAVVETVPENRTIFVFDLQWTDAGWRAATIRLGQESTAKPTP
ncbi:DUF6318 family protein [Amycolatopsis pigmentata]|uniref:DUF6318 family protein n=1 Tax=Amycolatopsis pigmentata TaxID=450801 RepID=A0ABW5G5N3_9PSEU